MTEATNHDPSPSTDQPSALLEALSRLFISSTIYPPAHPRCQELAEMAIEELGDEAGEAGSLRIEFEEQGVTVQGRALQHRSGPVSRLDRDLRSLCIDALQIDAAATASDLISLVSLISEAIRNSLRGTHDAEHWHAQLPATIEAVQEEYVAGGSASGHGKRLDSVRASLIQETLRPLAAAQVNDEVRGEIARFVGSVIDTTIEMSRQRGKTAREATGMEEEDLMSIAVLTIRRMIETRLNSADDLMDLDSLFADFERALNVPTSDQTTHAVIDRVKKVTEGLLADRFKLAQPIVHRANSVAEDQTAPEASYVTQLTRWMGILPAQTSLSSCPEECLSIAVQVLCKSPALVTNPAFRERLESLLTPDVVEQGRDVLATAVPLFCRMQLDEPLDFLLSLAFERWPQDGISPAQFLTTLLEPLDAEGLAVLWPHLAGVLLLTSTPLADKESMLLIRSLSEVPAETILRESERLITIAAARRDTNAQHFPAPTPFLYPMFEVLLTAQNLHWLHDPISELFRCHPLNSPPGVAFRYVRKRGPLIRRYLLETMQELRTGEPDERLRQQAGRLLCRELNRVDPAQRTESWVEDAIQALGQLPCPESREMLESIVNEKRWLMLNSWPPACRAYAQRALDAMNQRP